VRIPPCTIGSLLGWTLLASVRRTGTSRKNLKDLELPWHLQIANGFNSTSNSIGRRYQLQSDRSYARRAFETGRCKRLTVDPGEPATERIRPDGIVVLPRVDRQPVVQSLGLQGVQGLEERLDGLEFLLAQLI
jgi:hypothetical protein